MICRPRPASVCSPFEAHGFHALAVGIIGAVLLDKFAGQLRRGADDDGGHGRLVERRGPREQQAEAQARVGIGVAAVAARPLQGLGAETLHAVELKLRVNQPRRHDEGFFLVAGRRRRPCRGVKMAVVIGVAIGHERVGIRVRSAGAIFFDQG